MDGTRSQEDEQSVKLIVEGNDHILADTRPAALTMSDDIEDEVDVSPQSSGSDVNLSPKAKKVAVHSAFIKVGSVGSVAQDGLSAYERFSFRVTRILESNAGEALFGLVVMFDITLSCTDIDARAKDRSTPLWVEQASFVCLLLYTAEFLVSVAVRRREVFADQMVFLDIGVLFVGYVDLLVQAVGMAVQEIGMLRMLRIARTFRLIRVIRKFHALKELRKLMTMFTSCLKTLLWSFTFLFVAMTIWSMVAVELVHPVIQQLIEEKGLFSDCHDCGRSFESVMRANLTLFKTVVAGDSWGMVAVPVIEARPWTFLVFAGSEMSLLYGLLQLVVAVIVDTAAEFRQKDVLTLAMDMDADQQMDIDFLTKIFKRIDEDNSGELELDELIKGAETVPEFQSRLRVMDIDKADLVQLFHMLDEDSGGSISPEEFKYALSRWLHDSKTATRFVKHNSMQILEEQRMLRKTVLDLVKKMDKSEKDEAVKKPRRRTIHGSGMQCTPASLGGVDSFPLQQLAPEMGLALETGIPHAQFSRLGLLSAEGSALSARVTSSNPIIREFDKLAVCDNLRAATERAEQLLAESIQSAVKALHASALAATEQALLELKTRAGAGLAESSGGEDVINRRPKEAKNSHGLEELSKLSELYLRQDSVPVVSDSLTLTDIADTLQASPKSRASSMQLPKPEGRQLSQPQSSQLEEEVLVLV
eukprot:TRINITY_DN59037_c0_g1_i1.p1 TRINITY_DN59037_c0_g1~~TRINITY_DN59037_c0_g1_i1.p1  ORF type:complete len:703 (-),score=129.80 TRINITY_DN59037_c0_g1_i1:45-2153(-)